MTMRAKAEPILRRIENTSKHVTAANLGSAVLGVDVTLTAYHCRSDGQNPPATPLDP
ncbi:hypothetical protein BN2475_2040001 [Paraburkholderia ribeironis]|uniref:Uncharacterized protein n=1 Tax=Paraburkholderia ribeironis TaxID=1247936 RepID=A0A1N7SR19_9BURK|nr:hypothetical protein BN2475_2040001 [Paraburkholderia ribeironis]